MSEREFSKISGLPVAIQPIASDTIVEIETAGGQSFQAPFSALGGMPASHGSTHQDGGSDEIGTEFPTANAIPKADDAGQLTDWIADASTSVKGKVQLAENNESAANKAVQSNDTRMSNARMPTAHAASHIGGTDDLGLGTAALLDVGVADGVCGLDSSGKVSSSNLPSYVDDVIEVANYSALPVTGETGKIYVTLDDNLTYRWTGSAYVEISKSLALGETSSTAYRGDRGKTAYDHSQTAHAPSNADNTQAAINGASGKTTPSDNDILALLDSDAGNALKKLLWSNVKATLKTYFDTLYTGAGGGGSVDNTSRIAEYTGDGIPLIPDNVAGRTYFNDDFATVDSWVGNNATYNTVSVENGSLKVVYSGSPGISMSAYRAISGFNGKYAAIKIHSTVPITNVKYYDGSTYIDLTIQQLGSNSVLAFGVINSAHSSFLLSVNTGSTTPATAWYDTIYIGTGAYDTPALDRAGNGNNLTLNAVTPVNGKYGKEMSFNGSTSYAQASSPVIGTTGTVAVRFKLNSPSLGEIVSNADANSYNGIRIRPSAGILGVVIGGVSSNQVVAVGSIDTNYHTLVFSWSGSTVSYTIDNLYYTATQTVAMSASSLNMNLGRKPSGSDLLNGIISHFRYDPRIWTADEARAWSVNPDPDDSLSMSENPSAGDVMLWPDGGVSFFRSDNVGYGWATALGASRYSLGTRVVATQSLTSGTYTIPEGEYLCGFGLHPTSNGRLEINDSASNWRLLVFYETATTAEFFPYGMIRSDGTNMRVRWIAGTVEINLTRIG